MENYGITSIRERGVNGYNDISVKEQFKKYMRSEFSSKEKLLGRKLIVSEVVWLFTFNEKYI